MRIKIIRGIKGSVIFLDEEGGPTFAPRPEQLPQVLDEEEIRNVFIDAESVEQYMDNSKALSLATRMSEAISKIQPKFPNYGNDAINQPIIEIEYFWASHLGLTNNPMLINDWLEKYPIQS